VITECYDNDDDNNNNSIRFHVLLLICWILDNTGSQMRNKEMLS